MGTKVDDAVLLFQSGFNCAQSVFSTFSEDLGLDRNTALRISSGFGAGMGRMQETCGALSGAYMIAGLKVGQVLPDDKTAREHTYLTVRKMAEQFKKWNHTTSCRELLGHDLTTQEGKAYIEANGLIQKICTKCVNDAATIVDAFLKESESNPTHS